LVDVADADFVQVAVALDTFLQQRPDVALIVVLAEDQDAGLEWADKVLSE